MLGLVLLSLVSLSSAITPVPLLAYSSTSFSILESIRTNDQATAVNTIFDHEDICNFDAVIVASQEALHATKLKSSYSSIVDRYRSAENGVHLPYLTYSASPMDQARDLAVRCNSKLLHASTHEGSSTTLDVSQKHVICLEFPSMDEIDAETVARQLATFAEAFTSHLTLFTGVPSRSKRESAIGASGSIPAPEPTPSAPPAPVSYRILTPTLIFSFGVVFGLVVPLVYIAISALGGIKSPVSSVTFKVREFGHIGRFLNSTMKPAPALPTLITTTDSTQAIETSSFNAYPATRPSLNPSSGQASPSRPGSSHGVRIRPSTPQRHNADERAIPMSPGRSSFVGTVHDPDSFVPPMGQADKLWLWWNKLSSFIISSSFLILVVMWATSVRLVAVIPKWIKGTKPHVYAWDENATHWEKEKVVKDIGYYARQCGYDIKDETVETQDGYFLRMHRVVNPRHRPGPDGRGGFPVLILHGLFQSSGSFITSEERSLAFWLSEHGGYQVFLGNNRAVFGMGHRHLSRKDPRFWDWTIRELALYDLPALVEWVCLTTGYDKIAFIGHSQGNGVGFLSLSLGHRPELGEKLSCFIALAPAVFAGPLTHGFPFTVLNKVKWKSWQRVFGVLDYIPLMRYSYDYVPALIFSTMGYTMFAFLFEWTDTNWLNRRKNKMFRFTPTPVSSASIFWWCGEGGFADRQCTMDVDLPQWWDEHFPPLAIYYGGNDFLVAAEPLLERLATQEKHVEVIRAERVPLSEHCDFYWAADAVEWCFSSFLEDIEKTRPKTDNFLSDSEPK